MEAKAKYNMAFLWRICLAAYLSRASGAARLVKRRPERRNWLLRGVTFIISPADYGSLRYVGSVWSGPTKMLGVRLLISPRLIVNSRKVIFVNHVQMYFLIGAKRLEDIGSFLRHISWSAR